jgi:hypothetical protein
MMSSLFSAVISACTPAAAAEPKKEVKTVIQETPESKLRTQLTTIMKADAALKEHAWYIETMDDTEIGVYLATMKKEGPNVTTVEEAMKLTLEKLTSMTHIISNISQDTQKQIFALYKELKGVKQ